MGAEVTQIQSGIRNNLPMQMLMKHWNIFFTEGDRLLPV